MQRVSCLVFYLVPLYSRLCCCGCADGRQPRTLSRSQTRRDFPLIEDKYRTRSYMPNMEKGQRFSTASTIRSKLSPLNCLANRRQEVWSLKRCITIERLIISSTKPPKRQVMDFAQQCRVRRWALTSQSTKRQHYSASSFKDEARDSLAAKTNLPTLCFIPQSKRYKS